MLEDKEKQGREREKGTQKDGERKLFNEKKKGKSRRRERKADCKGGGDEGSQGRKRQGWMNGQMKVEVREHTERGL